MAAPAGAEYHWPHLVRWGEVRVEVPPTPEELNIPKAKTIYQIQSINLHTKETDIYSYGFLTYPFIHF